MNLGIFLSTFARTEFQILQFIPLIIVPQVLLAGIFWPVESLPGILAADGAPDAHDIRHRGAARGAGQGRGLDSPTVQLDILVLAGIAIVLAVVATLTIRREVA